MNEREHEIYVRIRSLASESPTIAVRAVLAGVEDGMQALRERLAKKDAAFLSALALAKGGRLGAETVRQLNQRVASTINPSNACELEQKVLDAVTD